MAFQLLLHIACILTAVATPIAAIGDVAHHLEPAVRQQLVQKILTETRNREPEVFRRRRVLSDAKVPASLEEMVDNFFYHHELSIRSKILRGFGFTEEDGLPPTMPGPTDLDAGFGAAAQEMALEWLKLENVSKHIAERRRLAPNDLPRLRREQLPTEPPTRLHKDHPRHTTSSSWDADRDLHLPHYLGPHPGSHHGHRISIAGGYTGLHADPDHKEEQERRRLFDIDPSRWGCSLQPVATYTDEAGPDDITENGVTEEGTCVCEEYHDAGDSIPDVGPVFQKWCKCREMRRRGLNILGNVVDAVSGAASDVASGVTGGRKHYGMLANVCNSYPAMGSASECTIINDPSVFPRKINCMFEVVLYRGFEIQLEVEARIGFGALGHEEQLAADLYIGLATTPLPRACWGNPQVSGFPDPTKADFACRALRFVSQKLNLLWDIGETLGGPQLQGSVDLYPFKMRFPRDYAPSAETTRTMHGGNEEQGRLKHVARIPVQRPIVADLTSTGMASIRSSSAFDGLSTNVANFNLVEGQVCIGGVAESMKTPGPLKNVLAYVSVALGMTGSDFCIGTPDLNIDGNDLNLGFRLQGSLFDPEKVDVMKMLQLIPPAWEEMGKIATNSNEKGVKSLLEDALNFKPLKDVPGIRSIPGDWKEWNLRSHLNNAIKLLLPQKKEFVTDVGAIVSRALNEYLARHHGRIPSGVLSQVDSLLSARNATTFKFPSMFRRLQTGRRRVRRLEVQHRHKLQTLATHTKIPAGMNFKATVQVFEDDERPRRLDEAGVLLPESNSFSVRTKEGGSCSLTTGDTFPKQITCKIVVQLKDKDETRDPPIPEIDATFTAQFQLAYALDGTTLQVIVRSAVKVEMPQPDLGSFQDLAEVLGKLDIGAFIDERFAGMIKLMPPTLRFPSPIREGELREIARANLTTLKSQGACLGNFHLIQPDRETVVDSQSIFGVLQAFASLLGGDLCGQIRKAETANGFKTDFVLEATLFDPSKVEVYPVINAIFDNVPSLRVLKSIVEEVLPRVTPGVSNMRQVKNKLNEIVRRTYPPKMMIALDVGALLKGLVQSHAIMNTSRAGGRRLSAADFVMADGMFDMGYIPPSDRYGEDPSGYGQSCGSSCPDYPSLAELEAQNDASSHSRGPLLFVGELYVLIGVLVSLVLSSIAATLYIRARRRRTDDTKITPTSPAERARSRAAHAAWGKKEPPRGKVVGKKARQKEGAVVGKASKQKRAPKAKSTRVKPDKQRRDPSRGRRTTNRKQRAQAAWSK